MEKKRIMIYPFNKEVLPLINYITLYKPEYIITSLISPSGIGVTGKDAGFADNRRDVGYIIDSNLERGLSNCDIVLIAAGNINQTIHTQSYSVIEKAISLHKNIVCLLELSKEIQDKYLCACAQLNISFQMYTYNNDDKILTQSINSEILKINYKPYAPIILVGGLIEETNNFEVFLSVVYQLRNKGQRVLAIGNKSYCEIFDIYSFPYWFLNKGLDEENKIKTFSRMVYALETKYRPDIIVIQIPGGILKYNDVLTNNYGVYAYLLSQCIIPDYFICCFPFAMFSTVFLENISNLLQQKFNYPIDCAHLSNVIIDMNESLSERQFSYLYASPEKYEEYLLSIINDENIPVLNLLKPDTVKALINNIIKEL